MIYRLIYCNKDGVEARIDIQKGLATPVIEVEGTERPFILSYNNDKGNKSGMFLSSSADIEIYETPDFNINNLKTSNETELSVTHYINNVISWSGFIIPDFFSIEVRSNPVITMTASDRIGTLKSVTLSNLPSMITNRELCVECLEKTGLNLPLKTLADFHNGVDDFFNSKVLSQRLTDLKGRSISCYDILGSILTQTNSKLLQRDGAWHIINKYQHELGSGKLYSSATSFTDWTDSIHNFNELTKGARRLIVPVASSVGVYHEHGGGKMYPENSDFSQGLSGWTIYNDFDCEINNNEVLRYIQDLTYWRPSLGGGTEKNNLRCNRNLFNPNASNNPYVESPPIVVTYPDSNSVEVTIDINAISTGAFIAATSYINFAIIAKAPDNSLYSLGGSGSFTSFSGNPYFHRERVKAEASGAATTVFKGVKGVLTIDDDNLEGYNFYVRIYGSGGAFTPFINSVSASFMQPSDNPKGLIYKTEQGVNFTKTHEIETSIFGDFMTGGLNGYFYPYPIDDTSSLYNSNNELTSKWSAPNDNEELPLLQHTVRQKARMFSVAHDVLRGELEISNFDPLFIFKDCNNTRYSLISGRFDFLNSSAEVEIEEIKYLNINRRDFIYSYFGDGESGIKSIGGISGGGGGSIGGGLTPEQLEVLSFWKKDPDNPNTIFTEMNAYSKLELSAYGAGDGGGSGGSDYERLDTWADYDSSRAEWVLSAFLGNDLNTRVTAIDGRVTDLENSAGGEILSFVTSGTGNAVTSIAKSGTVVTAYKNSNFLPLSGGTLTGNINITPREGTLGIRTHRVSPGVSDYMWPYGSSISSIRTGLGFGWYDTEWIIGNIRSGSADSYGFGIGYRNADGNLNGEFRIAVGGIAYLNNVAVATVNSNVASATKLQTARTIAGVSFDGTANIAIPFANLSSKPTTLGGYGITDAVTLNTAQTITGEKTFNENITLGVNIFIRGTDNYTGVWNVDNKLWRFGSSRTGSVSNIRSEKVGIGTDTPTQKLHVVGNILATGTTTTPKVIFNSAGWSMEQVGNELQLKYNNLVASRFLSDGSIVGLGEITAYGATTGGEGVSLLRTGGTMTGNLTMSADIIMNSGRAIGVSNLPLKLLGNSLTYNASNVLTEANTATKIKMGNGWTIEQTTSALTIKKNGVVKGTFNA